MVKTKVMQICTYGYVGIRNILLMDITIQNSSVGEGAVFMQNVYIYGQIGIKQKRQNKMKQKTKKDWIVGGRFVFFLGLY